MKYSKICTRPYDEQKLSLRMRNFNLSIISVISLLGWLDLGFTFTLPFSSNFWMILLTVLSCKWRHPAISAEEYQFFDNIMIETFLFLLKVIFPVNFYISLSKVLIQSKTKIICVHHSLKMHLNRWHNT